MSDRDRFDRFTEGTRKALSLAQEEARRFDHNYIGTEHLLLGLVRDEGGMAANVLCSLGVEPDKVRSAVEFLIGRGNRVVLGEIGLTPRARKGIELAGDEAHRLYDHSIGAEHLLLGLIREGEGIAAGVLESLGVNLKRARIQTILLRGGAGDAAQAASEGMPRSRGEAPPALREAIQELEATLHEKEAAILRQEYELAAELRDREVKLRAHTARLEADWRREQRSKKDFEG